MNTVQVYNRFGDLIIVDVEIISPHFFKLYYNEVQQGGVFNTKTVEGMKKFKSYLEKSFDEEEAREIRVLSLSA